MDQKQVGPPDGPVTRLGQEYLIKLQQLFRKRWSEAHAQVPLGTNIDGGFFGPSSGIVAGSKPAFLVTQVASDFASWGLPKETGVPAVLVATMTRDAVLLGGMTHFSNGRSPSATSPTLLWQAGYGGVSITQSELGIAYVFGAARTDTGG